MAQMADDWQVLALPSDDYAQWGQASRSLFAMPIWGEALIALGAEPLFAWNPARRMGALIALFRRSSFRIGVLGFPVAGEVWDTLSLADMASCAKRIGHLTELDLLRVNRSMAMRHDPDAIAARPESWVDDVIHWQPGASKRLRKDLAFARRANPELEIVGRCVDAAACFQLYAATIDSHGGRLRYTPQYYESLARIAERTDYLRIFTALDAEQEVRAFAVLAFNGGVGYYLHGGADAKGKREGVTDLLLEAMVCAARERGCTRFTLMSSPWSQSGLVSFKQKWSDQQGLSPTYDFAFGVAGRCGRLLSRWMARSDRRAAEIWALGQYEPESAGNAIVRHSI